MKWINKIKKFFETKPPLADLTFSEPDKDGVVKVTAPSGQVVILKTMTKEKVERYKLLGEGHSSLEVDRIIKRRMRARALKDILK